MLVVSLKSSSSVEIKTKKIFFNFVFFPGVIEGHVILCEHVTIDMILFNFSVIFHQIRTYFLKNIDPKSNFTPQKESILSF